MRKFKDDIDGLAPQFGGGRHHDAEEFMTYLLNGLDVADRFQVHLVVLGSAEATSRPSCTVTMTDTSVPVTMQWELSDTVTCPDCGHESPSTAPVVSGIMSTPGLPICRLRHVL